MVFFPTLSKPPRLQDTIAVERWFRQVWQSVTLLSRGKANVTTTVTLTPDQTTTILKDPRIGRESFIQFQPLTASAAAAFSAEPFYVSSQTNGMMTVSHASSPETDRAFRVLIVG